MREALVVALWSKRHCLSLVLLAAVVTAAPASVRAGACKYAAAAAKTVSLPDRPFGVRATADGCWLFVSLVGSPQAGGAIAVLRNERGDFRLDHVAKVPGQPSGMSLAQNGRVLAVAAQDRILLIDVGKLEAANQQPVIADVPDQPNTGVVYAQFALSDRWLFASEEWKGRIAVVDVLRAEQGEGARAIVNRVVTGLGPVGLALSPDGLRLFATSEVTPPSASMPSHCAPERPGDKPRREGQLLAIDVRSAATDSFKSVQATWAAGCSPVRVTLSSDGAYAWVTARGDGELLAFPARGMSDTHASTTSVRYKVGSSPVGVAVRPDGREVWVANSARFSDTGPGALTCISLTDGGQQVVRSGRFPRELIFLPDGKTLVASVFGSSALQFVPTATAGGAAGRCDPARAG